MNAAKITVPRLRFTQPDGTPFSDWEEKRLGDVFSITRGQVLAMSEVKPVHTDQHPYPVYSSQTLDGGLAGYFKSYLYSDAITWTTDGANAGETRFRRGPFYCTNVCGVLLNDQGWANKCVAEIINSVTKRYVSYVGNPKLMNDVMSKIVVALPHPDEQAKIAEVLSDADALITSLEKLIEKKKAIKQGAMQQLLTGEKRLSGFDGDWVKDNLGNLCDISAGGDVDANDFSLVSSAKFTNPIYSNGIENNDLYGFTSNPKNKRNSITITARGTIGVARFRTDDFTPIGRLLVLQPSKVIDAKFLSYFINGRIKFISETTGVPQLTTPQASKYEVVFPKKIKEQQAIAEALSDADEEINQFYEKLHKAKKIKAGMMQELLTGSMRLI